MGFSPYKDYVVNFVTNNPGCCKLDVAKHVSGRRNPSLSYGIVNTAIKNRWIYAQKNKNGSYSLFTSAPSVV